MLKEKLMAEKNMTEDMRAAMLDKLKAEQDMQFQQLHKLNTLKGKEQQQLQELNAKMNAQQLQMAKLEAEKAKLESKQQLRMAIEQKRNAEEQDLLSESILNDLKADNLISKRGNISVQFSSEFLIINGNKQSPEVYKKYKEKYVKGTNWNFNYQHSEE